MDILIAVIISGMAVAYVTEFISTLTDDFFKPALVKRILTLPLAYGACWYMDITGFALVISGPAAAFISLALLLILNRPVIVNNSRR
jgi:hypothetical protein